ncbi:MAG TPA: aspartyl protease family protein [Geobacteraceae bacterium]
MGKVLILSLSVWGALVLALPCPSSAEFYKYVDREGTVHFVDEQSKVPREYRSREKVYGENSEALSPAEKARLREEERVKRDMQLRGESGEEEKQEGLHHAAEKVQTREKIVAGEFSGVTVVGNRVFVPVTLGYGGREAAALLLLDTGSTATLITPALAEKLEIDGASEVNVRVIGGKVMRARLARLNFLTVGPHRKEGVDVVIVREGEGVPPGDGLLGMNVLRDLVYSIDFRKQEIHWIREQLMEP